MGVTWVILQLPVSSVWDHLYADQKQFDDLSALEGFQHISVAISTNFH